MHYYKIINQKFSSSSFTPAPHLLNNNYYLGVFMILAFIALFINIVILKSPFIILILLIMLSIIPFLSIVPSNWKLSSYTINIIKAFIHLFLALGLLQILFELYQFLMQRISYGKFKIFTLILNGIFLLYLILSRHILLLKMNNNDISIILLLIFFLSTLGVLLRAITTFTFFLIPFVFTTYPEYSSILLTELPDMPETSSSTTPKNPVIKGWFNKHTHNHYYPPDVPKAKFYRNTGVAIACIGIGLSAFACYHYRITALAAVKQAEMAEIQAKMAEIQAKMAEKQADQWEVGKGMMSEEAYRKKYNIK